MILVTGCTGNVGIEVAKALRARGELVRAGDIHIDVIRQRLGKDFEAFHFDFADPATYRPVLQGIRAVFLLRPPHIADVAKYLFPFIDAAKTAGVERVVFLSLIGVENNRRVPHFKVEEYLRASGIAWSFLRASFFMQNLNTQHRTEISDDDEIFIPAGKSKTSFIDVRDIGAVAALALCEVGDENHIYELTGAETLDYHQAAEIFTNVLGRRIIYRNPSLLQFLLRRIWTGTPLTLALVMTYLYHSTRQGMAALVTGEVSRLLGRPPISFEQYVSDYRDAWIG